MLHKRGYNQNTAFAISFQCEMSKLKSFLLCPQVKNISNIL